MAEKIKKKPVRKAAGNSVKTSGKPAGKAKSKTTQQKKTALKKPAVKRGESPAPRKARTAKKPVSKKTQGRPMAKTLKGRKIIAKTSPPKKPVRAESEEETKAALRKVLLRKRADLLQEIKTEISKYIKGETRQLVDTALDDGDWSVVDLTEDISLRHLSAHRETLLKIDESLRKLNEGTYGLCEDCGDVINEERLKILPFAIYCIDCQERREKLEEIERREGIG
jgi:DnaK suppressor protein